MTPYVLLPFLRQIKSVLQLFIDQVQVEEHKEGPKLFEYQFLSLFAGFGRQKANGLVGFLAVFFGSSSLELFQ